MSYWKEIASPAETRNLSDIMSEEYAKTIQLKAEEVFAVRNQLQTSSSSEIPENMKQVQVSRESGDDDVIAKILQSDLDKEHNYMKTETNNRDAKITAAYSKDNLSVASDNDSDYEGEDASINDLEYFESNEKEFTCLTKQNYSSKDTRMAVKQKIISSRRIAVNLLDERTRRILSKLVDCGYFKSINRVVYVGSKSIILHGYRARTYDKHIEEECAIKVFRTARDKSIIRNRNGKDGGFKNSSELASIRAENEHRQSGLSIYRMENVCVMNFVGKNQEAAPRLQNVSLTPEQWETAYKQITRITKTSYNCNVVHGNLVKNNILWWNNMCLIISYSHSVRSDNPKFFQSLLRDCHNICKFFKKKGVQNMKKSKEELFEWITGFETFDMGL